MGDDATIAIAVVRAFFFGYALTLDPLLASGLAFAQAARLALAADTISITIMEVVGNGVMLAIPDAMDSGLAAPPLWGSLAFADPARPRSRCRTRTPRASRPLRMDVE